MYLLDTGVLLSVMLKEPWALRVREEFDLEDPEAVPFTSIVCKGELLALAEKREWGERRRARLNKMLARLPIEGIGTEAILRAYAHISAWTEGKGGNAPGGEPPLREAKSMSTKQNDIWIAATAHVIGATLLSADRDYRNLGGIWFPYVYIRQKN